MKKQNTLLLSMLFYSLNVFCAEMRPPFLRLEEPSIFHNFATHSNLLQMLSCLKHEKDYVVENFANPRDLDTLILGSEEPCEAATPVDVAQFIHDELVASGIADPLKIERAQLIVDVLTNQRSNIRRAYAEKHAQALHEQKLRHAQELRDQAHRYAQKQHHAKRRLERPEKKEEKANLTQQRKSRRQITT